MELIIITISNQNIILQMTCFSLLLLWLFWCRWPSLTNASYQSYTPSCILTRIWHFSYRSIARNSFCTCISISVSYAKILKPILLWNWGSFIHYVQRLRWTLWVKCYNYAVCLYTNQLCWWFDWICSWVQPGRHSEGALASVWGNGRVWLSWLVCSLVS